MIGVRQRLRPIYALLGLRLSHWLLGLAWGGLRCGVWSWLRAMNHSVVPSVNVVDAEVAVVKWEYPARNSNDILYC